MSDSTGRRVDVLLVDDRPEQRLALASVVGELDVNVVEAASGREALRMLLQREFAVILLDVNMPGMDGFETAALIRGRKSSEHTPIIFVTAYGDDAFALRGYSLGAVDYVLAPMDPQVLKTKVSVFVELFRKSEQLKQQAASLEGHVVRLKRLAEASLALHAAREIDALLYIVADSAVALIGGRQVSASLVVPSSAPLSFRGARVGRHEVKRPEGSALDALERGDLAAGGPRRVRMSREQLAQAPPAVSGDVPLLGWLAAPLCASDGRVMGWLQLSDKQHGEFGPEDELLLVQLAQMASIAAENIFFGEAREANRLKDQFLATLSHELRTPLQTILTWACMLQEGPNGSIEQDPTTLAQGLAAIERSARAQTRLIEDLLDVSRIVTGKLVLEKRPLHIDEALEAAVEDARAPAQERGVELTMGGRCAEAWVLGDPHRLRQMLGNLISNAIKFTPEGGRATIEAAPAPDSESIIEISVSDTGKGIDPSFLPHLFEPFRQADSSRTRSHGGLGIGLAIVRHLVELHGGSVRAESEGEGRGARFVLRFPRAERARAAVEPSMAGFRPRHEPRLQGVRVLVVDDEADARASIELTLKQYGAIVVAVDSAEEAMSTLEREPIDALLSDLAMPGEDGISLIRRVRALPGERARLPAAALSAYGRTADGAEATLAGFDVHLPKPIDPTTLAAAIEGLVARHPANPRA